MTKYTCAVETPLGKAYALSDGESLLGLRFEKGPYPGVPEAPELPVFEKLRAWLGEYFSGGRPGRFSPLAPEGTAFQREIWAMLLTIPYGSSATYGALAKQYAAKHKMKRMSAQAVGGAVGKNPVSILIPCHRVIGADGSLVGFGEGLWRKEALLKIEDQCDGRVKR